MFKKAIAKAGLATATAGVLLIPTAGTVAPQISTVACQYPDSVATSTNVRVAKPVVKKGQRNSATVTVRAASGRPSGSVSFHVQTRGWQTKRFNGGAVTFSIPSNLAAGRTYGIDARFNGACKYRSSGDSAYVTVVKKRR